MMRPVQNPETGARALRGRIPGLLLLAVILTLAATSAAAQNRSPQARDDAATVPEDTRLDLAAETLLANDRTPVNGRTTIVEVGPPEHGTAALTPGGDVTYTPDPDFNGTDAFTYTIADSQRRRSTATVTVTVTPVNDAPVAQDDDATTAGVATVIDVLANDADAEGDALTVTSVGDPTGGTAAISDGGKSVTYTPDAGFSGTDTFTYTVSDGRGGTATAIVSIAVMPANDVPTARDDAAMTDEDTRVTVSVLDNDGDPDGDDLVVASVTQPAGGTAAVSDGGAAVAYEPDTDFNGTDAFTYTVSDGNGGTDTATVTVTVRPVNDAPVARDDAASTPEGEAVAVDVLANDGDPDGDDLAAVSVGDPTDGTAAVINGGAAVRYTPDAGFSGTDSFSYTVTDGQGGTATATVAVSVTSVNDAPVARNDAAATEEDEAVTIDVLANDRDPDGDGLSVASVTDPANGAAATEGTMVIYTPAPDFSGTDTFTYTVADGSGERATATVTVTVTPVNDAPVAVNDAASTEEDEAVTIDVLVNDRDPDGDDLTVLSVTAPADGAAVVSAGGAAVTYTPDPDFSGTDTFSYTVSDGNGGTATATVTVSLSAAGDAPTARDDAATTDEDTAVTVDVLDNDTDIDGDDLSVASVTQPASGTASVVGEGTLVRYAPDADFNGTDRFTYAVTDGDGGTTTATVTVTVTPVNDRPVARSDEGAVTEDGRVALGVLANDTDPDGDDLTVAQVTDPANGTATTDGATVTYVPDPDFNGTDAFAYTVSDGAGGTATATVTVAVTPVNDAPTARADAYSTPEDAILTVAAPGVLGDDRDPDGDPLAAVLVEGVSHGTLTFADDGSFTYAPDDDFSGTDRFRYRATDGSLTSEPIAVTITVGGRNDAPVAQDDAATTDEDEAVTVDVLANDDDPDGDGLTVGSFDPPSHGSATVSEDEALVYTPDPDFHGTDKFTYTVTDARGGTATATVTVTVRPVNDAPVARDDAAATDEGEPVAVDVLANDADVDGDDLVVTGVTEPARGTAAVSDGGAAVTYTPDSGSDGTDTFSYTVSDGAGGTATAAVTVAVSSSNAPPVARDDDAATVEGEAVVVDVLANDADPDGDGLSVASVTTPASGTAAVFGGGGAVRYVPEVGFIGTDTFTYTASDGRGGTATATVAVTVSRANVPPVALDDDASAAEGEAVTVDVLANDDDPDGGTLAVASVTQPTLGAAAVVSGGAAVRYTPDPGLTGADAFTYTVSDGQGGTATATVTVDVQAAPGAIAVEAAVEGAVRAGSDVAVSVAVAGFTPTSAELHYRPGGARDYRAAPLAPSGDGYRGTIPADAVTLRGVDYYVSLSDGERTVTDPAPAGTARHLQVQAAEFQAPVAYASDGFQMLSVPVGLADADAEAVFADDYGAYDPRTWRLFRWAPAEGRHLEYPALGGPLSPGEGFWLAARAGSGFDVEDGLSVDAAGPVTLALRPGWNQIGSPFAFPVAWESVGGHEAVSPPVAWDGTEYVFDRPVLEPWKGYFVENPTGAPVELTVPPVAADADGGASQAAARAAGGPYRLRLQATSGDLRDSHNVLGFETGAAAGRDRHDRAEPPPPGDHVRLSLVADGLRLAQSLQPDAGGAAWEAEVAASPGLLEAAGRTVRVTLHEEGLCPDGYGRYVLDLDRGTALPLTGDRFEVTLTAAEPVRRLRVIVGTEAFAASVADGLPLEPPAFALEPARPNPFRESATFAYEVPTSGRVTLEVFDLLGRRVAVLADGEHGAGRHTVSWHPSGAAGGVYVFRLRAGDLKATGKVVLLR